MTPPEPLVYGPLTRTDFVRYQGASGDMQPIHHDEPFAKAAGYDAPLAVGMFQAGILANWAAAWLGADNVRTTRVRWKAQCWPGDVLTFGGEVEREYEAEGQRFVDLALACTNQDGTIVVQGWATFVRP